MNNIVSPNPNLARNQEHVKNVWSLTLLPVPYWANMPLFSVCQADPFTNKVSIPAGQKVAGNLAKSSVFSIRIVPPRQYLNVFFWDAWGPTCTCSDMGAWARGGIACTGLNAQCSSKKASQQNYKPEKISVLRHCKQNGFCFLQDNELTRAHHTE